jgi:hypothetical protein
MLSRNEAPFNPIFTVSVRQFQSLLIEVHSRPAKMASIRTDDSNELTFVVKLPEH